MDDVKANWLPGANWMKEIRPKLPKCQMEVQVEPTARGNRKKHGKACGNKASIELLGKKLCIRHAQALALAYLIDPECVAKLKQGEG
jgi:hypothetical protein